MDGIYIVFELKNDGNQNIYIDGIEPNMTACQSMGLFLFLLDSGNMFPEILGEMELLKKDQPDNTEYIDIALQYKKLLSRQVDAPTMKPTDVFGFKH